MRQSKFATVLHLKDFEEVGEGLVSPEITVQGPSFVRAVASFNGTLYGDSPFCVSIRVLRDTICTDWYPLVSMIRGQIVSVPKHEDEAGFVDLDELCLSRSAQRFQVQISPCRELNALRSIEVAHYDPAERRYMARCSAGAAGVELAVPEMSQWDEDDNVAQYPYNEGGHVGHLVCAPSCFAMALSYHCPGPRPAYTALEVAQQSYDTTSDLYGLWPGLCKAAHALSVNEVATRYATMWYPIESQIAQGKPVVLSLKSYPEGALPGAAIPSVSWGHMVVCRGFTKEGDLIVNDPGGTAGNVRRIYDREKLFQVWRGIYFVIDNP